MPTKKSSPDPEAQADDRADRQSILLRAGLLVSDPMALSGLSPRVDEAAVPVSGTPYDTRDTTRAKVDCALCGHSRNHNLGFVVNFADGRRALIGIECAENSLFHPGAWAEMKAKSNRDQAQAVFDARAAPALKALEGLLPIVRSCVASVDVLEQLIADVCAELPDLYHGMAASARRDGVMVRTRMGMKIVTDRQGAPREVPTEIETEYARLPSVLPFTKDGLRRPVKKVLEGLEAAATGFKDPNLTLQQQQQLASRLRQLSNDLNAAHRDAQSCRGFFDMSLWEAIAKWGRGDPNRRGNYRLSRRTVRHSDINEDFGEVEIPTVEHYDLSPFSKALDAWPVL